MTKLLRTLWLFLLLLPQAALLGCNHSQAKPEAPPPPEVLVSLPVSRTVTDYEDFPGRTAAVNSIDIRARVTGYLDQMHFQEGAEVKQGELLFEIDPRPYQADLARAEANLVQAEAHVNRLSADYQRAISLLSKKAMSPEDFDKVRGDRAEAEAAVGVARASRESAKLNLTFTKVTSPIPGRITSRNIDPGNLVKADDTSLAVIVSLDPMYANFDLDERSTLRLQELIRKGDIKWSMDGGLSVFLGLANEEGFPHAGTINYADPRVDPDTGTWRLRGTFKNPQRVLSPGLYARIHLPIGKEYSALLVSEQALGTDQGQRFVYVVDEEEQVSYRRVSVGRLHQGLRVITDGLKKGERVVVSGLQRVRPGIQVNPKVVEMPVVSKPGSPTAQSEPAPANGDRSSGKGK